MRTLEHRGQKIICQYINDNFGRILAKKNIKWVLLDRKTEEIIISEHLDNDMAQEVIDNHLLFYLDDHTWIKVDDMTNDYLIRLQLLHLK